MSEFAGFVFLSALLSFPITSYTTGESNQLDSKWGKKRSERHKPKAFASGTEEHSREFQSRAGASVSLDFDAGDSPPAVWVRMVPVSVLGITAGMQPAAAAAVAKCEPWHRTPAPCLGCCSMEPFGRVPL